MIKVSWPSHRFELGPDGTWQFILYVCDDGCFYGAPFRQVLEEIMGILNATLVTSLELPAHEKNEDFIYGILKFGDEKGDVYFEHSLTSLSLASAKRDVIDEISNPILPHVVLA
jgi:hypothetical protein